MQRRRYTKQGNADVVTYSYVETLPCDADQSHPPNEKMLAKCGSWYRRADEQGVRSTHAGMEISWAGRYRIAILLVKPIHANPSSRFQLE